MLTEFEKTNLKRAIEKQIKINIHIIQELNVEIERLETEAQRLKSIKDEYLKDLLELNKELENYNKEVV